LQLVLIIMKHINKLAVLLFSSALLLISCKNDKKLPIYGNRDVETVKHADGTTTIDSVYQTIPAFQFLNQDSVNITNENFKNKIYIADFFFTSCTSICPIMHRNMKLVFDQYKNNPDVMFLSHTIDFKYDTPSKLKKYAQKLGVDGDKWQFAYGPKDDIYGIAADYLVAVGEDSTNKDGYIHQGWFILVDKDKKIRGAYEGTDDAAVAQLAKDIPILLAEYKK
jgi:protein SCO1/2